MQRRSVKWGRLLVARRPRRVSSKCSIINRTVAFNLENEWEDQLDKVVSDWTNFSGAVKRLIAASMDDRPQVVSVPVRETSMPVATADADNPAEEWDPTELF